IVGLVPCFSQISLIGTCSKRCSRRIFAFSSGLYRLRCLLLMLLFLGSWKSSLFQTPIEDISTEAEQVEVSLEPFFLWRFDKMLRTAPLSCVTTATSRFHFL